jgi:hypothetical protein
VKADLHSEQLAQGGHVVFRCGDDLHLWIRLLPPNNSNQRLAAKRQAIALDDVPGQSLCALAFLPNSITSCLFSA